MAHPSPQLVSRAFSDDDAAFAELVKVFLPALYRFVLTLVRDRDLAEDIVQETWVKIWKHRSRYDPSQSFVTWSYTIAKRTAFDALRKKAPAAFASFNEEAAAELLETPGETEADTVALLEAKEQRMLLDQALERIPPLYRTLLLLCYRDDLSLHEAAEILGDSYNTVKSRHQRALVKLRAALASDPAFPA